MPIVFNQPDPVRPDIGAAYGAAEQWSRDLPALIRQQDTLASVQGNAARLQSQASLQGQALAQQGQMAGEQRNFQQQAYGDQQRHQLELLARQQAGQQGLQQQHYELQAQLSQTQLSQQENLRMQRLQSALGAVAEQVQNGSLTPQEGNEFAMQIRTGLDPLQRRAAQAQVRAQELQYQQMQTQAARQDQLWDERTRFRNAGFSDRVSTFVDDYGNRRRVVLNSQGDVDYHATDLMFGHQAAAGEDNRARSSGGGSGSSGSGGQSGSLQPTRVDEARILREAETEVRREQTAQATPEYPVSEQFIQNAARQRALARIANLRQLDQQLRPPSTAPAPPTAEQRREAFQAAYRRVSAMFPEAPESTRREMASDVVQQEAQVSRRQPPGDQSPISRDAQPTAPPEPFSFNGNNLTPEQVRQRDNFEALRAQLRQANLHPQMLQQRMEAMNQVQQIIEQYGPNPAAMPPQDRAFVQRVIANTPRPTPPTQRPARPPRTLMQSVAGMGFAEGQPLHGLGRTIDQMLGGR